MKHSSPVTKFYPSTIISLIILLLVSSVSSHLPLSPQESNAKIGSSPSSISSLSSSSLSSLPASSSPSSSSSSSKVTVFPSSPHRSQEAANILFLPGGSEESSIQTVVPGKPVYEVRIPPSTLTSPYYLTITSNTGRGKSGGGGVNSSKNSRIRYPVSYPGTGVMKSVKGSTPSCITLKSLWRSGKLVLLDSISTDESSSGTNIMKGPPSRNTEVIYGRLVPNQQSERIDESIANVPPGRFGEFAPPIDEQQQQQLQQQQQQIQQQQQQLNSLQQQQQQQPQEYGFDTNHVSLEMNTDSTSKPIVKLSGRSDSYLDEGPGSASMNSMNSMNTGDTSSKPGRLSASEFFNAVWHNGPVKF